MHKKSFVALVAITLILVLGAQTGFSREKEEATADTDKIMHKLDEVLANQNEILAQFDQIKQELEVIKVRASR